MKYYVALLLALSISIAGLNEALARSKSSSGSAAVAAQKPADTPKPAETQKSADEPSPQPEQMPEAPVEPQRSRSRSRQRFDPRNLRTSPAMRELFDDVIATPSRSVVEIYADGKRVCLGTIVSADGHIATKASLVKGEVTCRLRDLKERVPAKLIGSDNDYDLAILKVNKKDLTPIKWSTKDYELGSFVASPNIDGKAHAIGVMSVERRRFSLRQPQAAGQQRGYLGVMTAASEGDGVRLQQVVPNSGAAAAGLKANDVLLRFNEKELKQPQELIALLSTFKPKDEVKS